MPHYSYETRAQWESLKHTKALCMSFHANQAHSAAQLRTVWHISISGHRGIYCQLGKTWRIAKFLLLLLALSLSHMRSCNERENEVIISFNRLYQCRCQYDSATYQWVHTCERTVSMERSPMSNSQWNDVIEQLRLSFKELWSCMTYEVVQVTTAYSCRSTYPQLQKEARRLGISRDDLTLESRKADIRALIEMSKNGQSIESTERVGNGDKYSCF